MSPKTNASPITSVLDLRPPRPPYGGLPADVLGRLNTLREERDRCAEVLVPDIDQRMIVLLVPFRQAG